MLWAVAPLVLSTAAAEGGCLADARAHAVPWILRHHRAELAQQLGRPATRADLNVARCQSVETMPDLDGDGVDETVVLQECFWGVKAMLHAVYFSNRGCLRFAGAMVSGAVLPLATRTRGVLDVETIWADGCAGADFTWAHYRWTGRTYRAVDRASCQLCPAEGMRAPPGANQHPRCRAAAAPP